MPRLAAIAALALGLGAAPAAARGEPAAPDACLGGLADAWARATRATRKAPAAIHGALAGGADAVFAAHLGCAGDRASRTRRVEAAFVRVLARYAARAEVRRADDELDDAVLGRVADPGAPTPGLAPADLEVIAAADDFLRLVAPDVTSDEAVTARFLRAAILYRGQHLADAAAGFATLVEDAPDHELAATGFQLMLDALNRLGRDADLVRWVGRVRGERRFARLLARVPEVHRLAFAIARRQAHERERAGDWSACAATNEAAANAFPNELGADEALYNATVCWLAAGRLREARRSAEQLKKLFGKKSPLSARAMQLVEEAERQRRP